MLSVKKTLAKVLNALDNGYVVENKTSTQTTVGANGYSGALSVNVAKSGYTPIGIVGISKSGGSSLYCFVSNYSISGNNITFYLRNTYNGSATVTTTFSVLYKKNL